jgi:hypothetical protein
MSFSSLLTLCRGIVTEMSTLPTTVTTTNHESITNLSYLDESLLIGAVGAAATHLLKDTGQDGLTMRYRAEIYLRSILHGAYNRLYQCTAPKSYIITA